MKTYPIYEIFTSIQGEGANTGRAAIFVRLAGCSVGCEWCDSKGAQDTKEAEWLTATEIGLRFKVQSLRSPIPVIITGGEPTMYDLTELTDRLHAAGHQVWLETSGTETIRGTFDWICLSPKQHRLPLAENLKKAGEIKVIIGEKSDFEFAEELFFKYQISNSNLYLQPEWTNRDTATQLIVDYIKVNPQWRLSLQTHKYIGVE